MLNILPHPRVQSSSPIHALASTRCPLLSTILTTIFDYIHATQTIHDTMMFAEDFNQDLTLNNRLSVWIPSQQDLD